MHGVTRSISFTISAERVGHQIDVLADIPITFSEWNISNLVYSYVSVKMVPVGSSELGTAIGVEPLTISTPT